MVVCWGVGAGVFIEFLKRLIHGRRRTLLLIVDGHPTHRSKSVSGVAFSLGGKLELYFCLLIPRNSNPISLSGMM
jgi:hypothetical protein